jgi:hypothetical protein
MKGDARAVPNEEDGNPFLTLGQLLGINISVGTLATAIEQHGIYTWDRFGRFGKASDPDKDRALSLLEVQHKWEVDAEASFREDPRSPLEQCEGDWDSPFDRFGWASEVAPDFDNIRRAQSEEEPKRKSIVRRKAPDSFVAAFVKLAVEIAKRDPAFNIEEMPGIKADLHELAIKFDDKLDHSYTTFDSYIEGLCKFKRGSRASNYYRSQFPEYFK